MTHSHEVEVERLTAYSDEDAAEIGRLMPFLSESATGDPIPESILRSIIESSDREQFAARLEGRIVGSAVLNIIVGNLGSKAWLEDFVKDPEFRGVGQAVWDEMIRWCQEKGIKSMEFTSREARTEAHTFYYRQGAKIRSTTPFQVAVPLKNR